MMMDEAKLIEKLRLIEALFSGAKTEGEKDPKHSSPNSRKFPRPFATIYLK